MPRKPSHKQLLATPKYMVDWLRSMPPRRIVTKDLMDATQCLGATFLQAFGYPKAYYSGLDYRPAGLGTKAFPVPNWFQDAFDTAEMHKGRATAKKLADVIEATARSK